MNQAPQSPRVKNIPAMLADTDALFKQARQGSESFRQAKPFPHLLLPGMIKAACRVALCEGLRQWKSIAPSEFYPQGELPSVVHLLLWELSSSTLIRHFASLAGTPPLLPDPFLVGAGSKSWQEQSAIEMTDKDAFSRHPRTDLLNVLRLEIFLADEPGATFPLELVGADQPSTFYSVSNGTALITASDNHRMILRSASPEHWHSFVSYFYTNDRARSAEEISQGKPHGY
jgi:hypothetical protein